MNSFSEAMLFTKKATCFFVQPSILIIWRLS